MTAAATGADDRAAGRAVAGPQVAALARWLARHETPLVIALVGLAAAVRVLRWHLTAVMFNDGPVFLLLAQALERLDLATALGHPFHPLYPVLVAGADALLGNLELAAVTVSVAAGSAAVWVIHRLVRAGLSPAHGVLAAALLALHPMAIEFTGDVQSEGLYLGLFLAGSAALVAALRHGGARRALGAGALTGAAYLTRPEGLGLACVAAGLLALDGLRGRRAWREVVSLGLALGIGALLVAGPYVGWLRAVHGVWSVTQKKSVSVLVGLEAPPPDAEGSGLPGPEIPAVAPPGAPAAPREPAAPGELPAAAAPQAARAAPPATDADAQAASDASAQAASAERPGLVAGLLDVARTHVRAVQYGTLLLLLLALVFGIAAREDPVHRRFVVATVGLYLVVLVGLALNAGYVSARHALPPMTLLFGYAAGGLLAASGRIHARWPRVPAVAAVALVGLLVVGIGLGKALRPDRVEELAERRAAEWLRVERVPVHAVAARKQRVAWYAHAPYVELPLAAYAEGLRELGVSHVVLADDDRERYPRLVGELGTPALPVLHRVRAGGQTATIYVLPPPPPR